MALKQPAKISFLKKARLIFLLLFRPSRFDELEKAEAPALEMLPNDKRSRADHVRSALIQSFLWVVVSSLVGAVLGSLACSAFGRADLMVTILSMTGAAVLLWATLAIRGWEVQSHAGVTLGEQVNRWIYRLLYCIGTTFIVTAVVWSVCM